MQHTRALWSAVVLQAHTDLTHEHYTSVAFSQAESFFFAPGEWAYSREAIADMLELHADDLSRGGRKTLAARHLRDGGPEAIIPADALPECGTRPAPKAPSEASAVTKPRGAYKPRGPRMPKPDLRNRDWWIKRFMATQDAA